MFAREGWPALFSPARFAFTCGMHSSRAGDQKEQPGAVALKRLKPRWEYGPLPRGCYAQAGNIPEHEKFQFREIIKSKNRTLSLLRPPTLSATDRLEHWVSFLRIEARLISFRLGTHGKSGKSPGPDKQT